MTTSVTVDAHAGWDVKVTIQDRIDDEWKDGREVTVKANTTETLHVYDTRRVIVEEVKK